MNKNMGNLDRIIRVLIAVVAAYLYFTGVVSGTLGIILVVVAVVFVFTSLISFCPIYAILGVKTCSVKKAR